MELWDGSDEEIKLISHNVEINFWFYFVLLSIFLSKLVRHPGLGDRHLSELSGKVYHRKITLKVQYDRNVPLESKVLHQKIIDIVFQIVICDRSC